MNKTANYSLTIVIPVYNEEDNIKRLQEVVGAYLPACPVPACALFVNDGSKDRSLELIQEACKDTSHFYYISLKQNRGLSAAMKAGIDTAESKYVGYMDADMQTDVRDFDLLLKYAPEYPLVMGIRARRKDSAFKRMQSKIANSFRRMMTHDGATDGGKFYEIPVRHYPRQAGVSKYHLWNRLISPFKDCFAFRWMAHRYINYQVGENNL